MNREIVHLGNRELGIRSTNELNESTSFAGRNLAVGDLSKVMEEALLEGKKRKGREKGFKFKVDQFRASWVMGRASEQVQQQNGYSPSMSPH